MYEIHSEFKNEPLLQFCKAKSPAGWTRQAWRDTRMETVSKRTMPCEGKNQSRGDRGLQRIFLEDT